MGKQINLAKVPCTNFSACPKGKNTYPNSKNMYTKSKKVMLCKLKKRI